jgi:hypothetical protein
MVSIKFVTCMSSKEKKRFEVLFITAYCKPTNLEPINKEQVLLLLQQGNETASFGNILSVTNLYFG